MTSGVSWNESGLSSDLEQAAREAARRSGLSLDDWMRQIKGSAKPETPAPRAAAPEAAGSVRGARLADTVAKLNARLESLTTGRGEVRMAPEPAPEPSPSIAPQAELSIDQVIAEIAARQHALDEVPAPQPEVRRPAAPPQSSYVPPQPAMHMPSPALAPDLSGLERQLSHITAQIESLRRPCGVEDALAGLRTDLAGITQAINEAMPRRALETVQGDLHRLAERVDQGYGRGADPSALSGIERKLDQMHAALDSMMPAEALAGFDARVAELSHKMDNLGGQSPDPDMMRYLEAAINELRELSDGVASAEGVASLAGDIHALGERIDRVAHITSASGLEQLEGRVGELTRALDTRVTEMGPLPQNIESLVKSLSDKLDRTESATSDNAAFEQLEHQITSLVSKIDAADERFANLGSIERGIQQLTMQVREVRQDAAATAERVAHSVAANLAQSMQAPQSGIEVDAIRRDLEALHANHSESDQRTHDTLEAVHETLERLVERLANVETDLRNKPAMAPAPAPMPAAPMPVAAPTPVQQAPMRAPAPVAEATMPALRPAAPAPAQRTERAPIDPDLPADTPLEPGSMGRLRSPAERIAASEAALGAPKREGGEVTGKANFIAAARRAAQAAANEGVTEAPRADEAKPEDAPTSLIGRFLANRRRALMLGVSALLVLYGTMQVVSMFSDHAPPPATQSKAPVAEPKKIAAAPGPVAPAPAAAPAIAAEPPAPKQFATESLIAPKPAASLIAPTPVAITPEAPAAAPADITGSVKPPVSLASGSIAPDAASLPAGVAGAGLRAAAAAGNPAAEYEIGARFAEGRGTSANLELAAQWFERAARQGLAPALYRLGSLHEKGQGVKKDLDKARQLYLTAADKGNAKAVHNMAVLYAEGIDGKPDYRTAAQWFRKAADKGIADSQYNLGILYARGIGVEQNLAESYKWFSLAAAQGDADAGKKRDDVAGRLDQQSLVAAKLAVQTFAPDTPPDEAMNVRAPAGGWDKATAPAPAAAKPAARRKPAQPS